MTNYDPFKAVSPPVARSRSVLWTLRRDMESRRCDLIEHGPDMGTEIQVFNGDHFIYGRLFPSETLAVAEGAAWRAAV